MMKLMKTLIIECNTSEKSFGKTIKEKVISILEKNKRAYDFPLPLAPVSNKWQ